MDEQRYEEQVDAIFAAAARMHTAVRVVREQLDRERAVLDARREAIGLDPRAVLAAL